MTAPQPGHDWPIDDSDFNQLRSIIHDQSGIVISAPKKTMVRARLYRRLTATGKTSIRDYLHFINSLDGRDERREFISSLTTNVTHFFREAHHFDTLCQNILPDLRHNAGSINIWSAGCSSGQEPYSIAMAIAERHPDLTKRVTIFGTDIDHNILERAKSGFYSQAELSGLSPERRGRFFEDKAGGWQVRPAIAQMVRFSCENLTASKASRDRFDVIFCRNVAIYFDQETQERLWRRLAESLKPQGWLLIGHSERVPSSLDHCLETAGVTTYRRL
ncbi:MAG: protein-glutamate O-methyltransferase CheR [Paracoccus sp. (in: a-proteobacteria)]|nr:protein-glutamate O-methyltransferase CheR [Paracoccus sp. (in: a-proteobacteria)]